MTRNFVENFSYVRQYKKDRLGICSYSGVCNCGNCWADLFSSIYDLGIIGTIRPDGKLAADSYPVTGNNQDG